nr:hypothetical protein [Tanacetum cinerariifolium]
EEEVHEENDIELAVDIFDDICAVKVDLDTQNVYFNIDGGVKDQSFDVAPSDSDPFGFEPLINKKSRKDLEMKGSETPNFPPGFTPTSSHNQQDGPLFALSSPFLLARIRRCSELIVGCGKPRSNHRGQERHHVINEMKCQFLDKRLNALTMMVPMRQTVICGMLVHMVMTEKTLLLVETETTDTLADDVDTVFCSADVGRSKQVGQKFVHSSIEPHWHDIHVDRDMHEVDRR